MKLSELLLVMSFIGGTMFSSLSSHAQVQVGSDILGENLGDKWGKAQWGNSVVLSANGLRVASFTNNYEKGINYLKVYELNNGEWIQIGKSFIGTLANENDMSNVDLSLSADGSILAIGQRSGNPGSHKNVVGGVLIYKWNGESWVQMGKSIDLDVPESNVSFGLKTDLSADGLRLVVGIPVYSGKSEGKVLVYDWNGNSWEQRGIVFSSITDKAVDDFGASISLSADGQRLAIGAERYSQVVIYELIHNNWVQMGKALSGEKRIDSFGSSLALSADGQRLAIGEPYFEKLTENQHIDFNLGAVRVYEWNGNNWIQMGKSIEGKEGLEFFGASVSLSSDGTRIAVGSSWDQVKIYELEEEDWVPILTSLTNKNSKFFETPSVSISGDGNRLAMGFAQWTPYREHSGCIRIYDLK